MEKPFSPPMDNDSVLKEAESSRRRRERQLENDFCILLFRDLNKLVFRPSVTVSVVRILQSDQSADQKAGTLEKMELGCR
jgi:hypothetical protein